MQHCLCIPRMDLRDEINILIVMNTSEPRDVLRARYPGAPSYWPSEHARWLPNARLHLQLEALAAEGLSTDNGGRDLR